MKALLVQPPIEDFYDTAIRTYPLSLLYLATKIKDICDVSVMDFRTGKKPKVLAEHPFPELDAYYRNNVYTPFSLFNKYYRFGFNDREIKDAIRSYEPQILGISSLFTAYAGEAVEIARMAKEVDKDIITVFGGTHPTFFPHALLTSPYVDYVVRGEGETPLFQLINCLGSKNHGGVHEIQGVSSKTGDSIHISGIHVEGDIDLIPDRRFLTSGDYQINRRNYTFFLTSRGCPFKCAFCGKPPIPYRRRSLEGIEAEIRDCMDAGIQVVDFEDDMLNLDRPFFSRVLSLFEGTDMTLSAMNGIYAETLDVDTLKKMYDAGFRRLNISLVDISESVMTRQNRLFSGNFLALLPYLEASPFLVEVHFIIGLPQQTPEEVLDTMIFLMGERVLPGPSIFYLAPNSPVFNSMNLSGPEMKDHQTGFVSPAPQEGQEGASTWQWQGEKGLDPRWMRSSFMLPTGPLFPRDTIYTCVKLARFINFVKRVLDRGPSLTRLSDLPELLAAAREPYDRHILSTLIAEKRFICFDTRRQDFVDEPQDSGLVRLFFRKARGLRIKGFKTTNALSIDVPAD